MAAELPGDTTETTTGTTNIPAPVPIEHPADPITPLPASETEETIHLTPQQLRVLRYLARRHMRSIRVSKRQHFKSSESEAAHENNKPETIPEPESANIALPSTPPPIEASQLNTQPLMGITHLKTQPLQAKVTPIPAASAPAPVAAHIASPQYQSVVPAVPEPASEPPVPPARK